MIKNFTRVNENSYILIWKNFSSLLKFVQDWSFKFLAVWNFSLRLLKLPFPDQLFYKIFTTNFFQGTSNKNFD